MLLRFAQCFGQYEIKWLISLFVSELLVVSIRFECSLKHEIPDAWWKMSILLDWKILTTLYRIDWLSNALCGRQILGTKETRGNKSLSLRDIIILSYDT